MTELRDKLYSSALFTAIKGNGENYFFTGLSGSLDSFLISYIFLHHNKKLIFCSDDLTKLFHLREDLSSLIKNDLLTIYLSS
jgi:hypothetical protein